jgi:hypothetical protein
VTGQPQTSLARLGRFVVAVDEHDVDPFQMRHAFVDDMISNNAISAWEGIRMARLSLLGPLDAPLPQALELLPHSISRYDDLKECMSVVRDHVVNDVASHHPTGDRAVSQYRHYDLCRDEDA